MADSGVDSNKDVHPILTETDGRQIVTINDGDNTANVTGASALQVHVSQLYTDGVNRMPAGDNAVRPIFVRLADGSHEGKSFIASHFFSGVADQATVMVRILVGANKELYATASVSAQGRGKFRIAEGTTYSADGTAVTIYDKNRTTANTSDALCYHTPTVDVAAPKFYDCYVPTDSRQRAMGSVRTNGEAWILKKSTDYLFLFVNYGGADMGISMEIEFYEV